MIIQEIMTGNNVESARFPGYPTNRQFNGFIENSPVGMHMYEIKNDALIFMGGNKSADRILNIKHSELVGLPIEEAFPPLKDTSVPSAYTEVAKLGKTWEFEEIQYKDDRISGFYKVTAFQTYPGSMIAMFTDITDIKNIEIVLKVKNDELLAAEEELMSKNEKLILMNDLLQSQNDQYKKTFELLQQSELKFKTAFQTSPDSVNINRLEDGLFIEINDGFTNLTGYTWEDVKGRTSAEINIWADIADREKMVKTMKEKGRVINLEALFQLKNGEIKHGVMTSSVFRFQDQDYVLSITRDVEEIVKARVSLKNSEEKFRQLAENIDDVFWLTEEDRVLYINGAVERMFGYDRNLFYEQPMVIMDIIYPDDLEIINNLIVLIESGSQDSVSEKFRIFASDRKVRWIWLRLFPIFNASHKLYRMAGIASDITEEMEFEIELQAAKEKAQESDKLKSAFLANLSHEIRTPMNGIIGFSELLTHENTDSTQKKQYVELIGKCSDQLLHLIDDLVDISKIEAKQMRVSLQECNISALLNELFLFFQQQLKITEKTSVILSKHNNLSVEESIIFTDEYRLRQVLDNLLNNALKFTGKGHIRFGLTKEEPGVLKFFVEDSGLGIPKNLFDDIFKPFRQADDNDTREFGGAGLGLSISRGLVILLGGRLWVESEMNKGSTFYFTIPYKPAVSIHTSHKETVIQKIVPDWKYHTILVVEDDDMNYLHIQELLKPTGINLIRASTGYQAIEETQKQNPELIIMDIQLPALNGLDATKRIRKTGNKIPIIALTAFAMPEDKNLCLNSGCDDYLSKPVHKDILVNKIETYLQKTLG